MVAPLTDPAWTPLFLAVDGVVVNVGGQVSHAVIVSREMGIPCVVSVADATEQIQDGATITVDGTNGNVTLIRNPYGYAHTHRWTNPSLRHTPINGERYIAPEFMEREWDHIWSKVWLLVARAPDIPNQATIR